MNLLSYGKDPQTDEEILAASIKHPSLFGILVDRYTVPFQNKARRILGWRDEVDDIVQDTFVKIYQNAHRFQVQEGASFKSWGYKILINTTFTYYQKLKKKDESVVILEEEIMELLPDHSEDKETVDDVGSVFARMPGHLARILKLHFIMGMPQKEIAKVERISVSAVKTRIHRAKKHFKQVSNNMENKKQDT